MLPSKERFAKHATQKKTVYSYWGHLCAILKSNPSHNSIEQLKVDDRNLYKFRYWCNFNPSLLLNEVFSIKFQLIATLLTLKNNHENIIFNHFNAFVHLKEQRSRFEQREFPKSRIQNSGLWLSIVWSTRFYGPRKFQNIGRIKIGMVCSPFWNRKLFLPLCFGSGERGTDHYHSF